MLTDILQPTHLLIVLVVALVVLGPKRLPDAGRALGQGLREFRHSITTDPGDRHGQSSASRGSEDPTPGA
jgi:sec-independent protein translocase protein TatA